MSQEIIIKISIPEFKRLFARLFAFLKRVFESVWRDVKAKRNNVIAALIIAGLFTWLWGIGAGALWFLFLMFLFYGWENRIIGVLALISLALCPILLIFSKNNAAEQMAVYAYFFLVMTVVLQIVEYKRHPEEYKEENEEK